MAFAFEPVKWALESDVLTWLFEHTARNQRMEILRYFRHVLRLSVHQSFFHHFMLANVGECRTATVGLS